MKGMPNTKNVHHTLHYNSVMSISKPYYPRNQIGLLIGCNVGIKEGIETKRLW